MSQSVRDYAAGVVLSCLLLCAGTTALAQGQAQASDLWEYEVTPYIWGCGLDGETAIGRLPAQGVEALFSDLVSVLQTAGMVGFTGQRGTWGFASRAARPPSTSSSGQGTTTCPWNWS
jgi:hypothetical protein